LLYVPDAHVHKLFNYASTLENRSARSSSSEWVAEVRRMQEYGWKILCGRRVAVLVKRGATLPHASLSHVCRRLEAMTNFSAVLVWLMEDVSPHFVTRVDMTAATTMPVLITNAVQPLYESLPPYYVPRKNQVTQALLNWWAHKLSTQQ
jgi:hypothetical protein